MYVFVVIVECGGGQVVTELPKDDSAYCCVLYENALKLQQDKINASLKITADTFYECILRQNFDLTSLNLTLKNN